MATVQGNGASGADRTFDAQWGVTTGFVASGDIGTPLSLNAYVHDATIQATGTFTGGLSIALMGSNDGVNYSALKDAFNTVIAMTDNSVVKLLNLPKFIKPQATVGTGGANANVYLHGQMYN